MGTREHTSKELKIQAFREVENGSQVVRGIA